MYRIISTYQKIKLGDFISSVVQNSSNKLREMKKKPTPAAAVLRSFESIDRNFVEFLMTIYSCENYTNVHVLCVKTHFILNDDKNNINKWKTSLAQL